jgi:hypothetical protein
MMGLIRTTGEIDEQPDFDTFPLWRRGNQFEDFEVDQVFEH